MRKILYGLVILVIALVVVINVAGNVILGRVLENAIGAPVQIGKVQLDPVGGKAGIYDLKIKNPKGFKSDTLATIPEISLAIDLKSILSGMVHIPQVVVNLKEIVVEKNGQMQVNLTELAPVKQMTKGPGAGAPAPGEPGEPSKQSGKAMTVKIDHVMLSLGSARYVDSGGAQLQTKEFPLNVNETLNDVTNPRQVTQQIVAIVLKRVGMAEITSQLGSLTKGLETQVKGDLAKSSLGGFANKLKSQLGDSASSN